MKEIHKAEDPFTPARLVALACLLGFLSTANLSSFSSLRSSSSWLSSQTESPSRGPRVQRVRVQRTLDRDESEGRWMPDLVLKDIDGKDFPLFDQGLAPAVVTEFLIGCADCRQHFLDFPALAKKVKAANQEVVNVAYMGTRAKVEKAFRDRDFGGPVVLDHKSELQRHFRIGTFTVWLLGPQGQIEFQGSPKQAAKHLDAHLERRRQAAEVH